MAHFTPRGLSVDTGKGLSPVPNTTQFPWQAKWRDEVVGLLEIDKPFTPYATSRWINFDVQPKP